MFIILFIYINLLQILFSQVIIPFNQLFSCKNEINYNSSVFLDDNLLFISFATLNIGQPPKKVYSFLTQNITDIYFHNNNNIPFNNKCDFFPLNSDSHEIINITIEKQENEIYKKYFIKDYVEFYGNDNYINKNKIKIIYYFIEDKLKNYIFEIGFPINKNLNKIDSSTFIHQLKSNQIINNYQITICFNSSNEGFYLIGNLPHYFDSNKFKEYQLISTYSIPNNPLFQFQILFDEVYISDTKKTSLYYNKIYSNFDLGLIKGTTEYFDEINKLFFKEYYKKGICISEMIKKNIYDSKYSMTRLKNYEIISCKKNEERDNFYFNVKLFPSLCFYHQEMNFTFYFNYNDLFEEKNGVYYFKIIFSLNEDKEWQFGKSFFEKYTTTFDIDSRKLYFYNENIVLKILLKIKIRKIQVN